jgi:channel protein (hemolysin III family)
MTRTMQTREPCLVVPRSSAVKEPPAPFDKDELSSVANNCVIGSTGTLANGNGVTLAGSMAVIHTTCTLYGIADPISAISHIIAAGLASIAAFGLVPLARQNRTYRLALTVYAACVVSLLSISGTYHALQDGPARLFMKRADYLAIWLLIAGTFTAIHGVMCRGFWRRWMLTFIGTYTAAAFVAQLLWFEQLSGVLGLLLYLILGWMGLATVIKLGRRPRIPCRAAPLVCRHRLFRRCHLRSPTPAAHRRWLAGPARSLSLRRSRRGGDSLAVHSGTRVDTRARQRGPCDSRR